MTSIAIRQSRNYGLSFVSGVYGSGGRETNEKDAVVRSYGSGKKATNFMPTETTRIIDIGRGPQIEGSRLTIMDIFYYLRRGHDYEYIHEAIPSLTREQFDAVIEYVDEHHDELLKMDRRVEERIHQRVAEQKTQGLLHEIDESVPIEERAARLREKLYRRVTEQTEKNRGGTAD